MTSTQLQTMKLFNLIATAAVIGASSFLAPAAVEAATSTCYRNTSGNTICIHSVRWDRSNPNFRRVTSTIDGANYSIDNVRCNPAHRYNYKENLYGIACFQFS